MIADTRSFTIELPIETVKQRAKEIHNSIGEAALRLQIVARENELFQPGIDGGWLYDEENRLTKHKDFVLDPRPVRLGHCAVRISYEGPGEQFATQEDWDQLEAWRQEFAEEDVAPVVTEEDELIAARILSGLADDVRSGVA